jgi:hypothetical protein
MVERPRKTVQNKHKNIEIDELNDSNNQMPRKTLPPKINIGPLDPS